MISAQVFDMAATQSVTQQPGSKNSFSRAHVNKTVKEIAVYGTNLELNSRNEFKTGSARCVFNMCRIKRVLMLKQLVKFPFRSLQSLKDIKRRGQILSRKQRSSQIILRTSKRYKMEVRVIQMHKHFTQCGHLKKHFLSVNQCNLIQGRIFKVTIIQNQSISCSYGRSFITFLLKNRSLKIVSFLTDEFISTEGIAIYFEKNKRNFHHVGESDVIF